VIRVIERAEQDRVGPALLASATHPAVAPALERVTAARLAVIATVFGRLGFPAAEARRRALLAYSAYLGHGQLAHSTPGVLPATKAERHAYLNDAVHALTARDSAPSSGPPAQHSQLGATGHRRTEPTAGRHPDHTDPHGPRST
jgi:hypothetical protein